jgi:prepilin-type processing-associated H-X9-DG protein
MLLERRRGERSGFRENAWLSAVQRYWSCECATDHAPHSGRATPLWMDGSSAIFRSSCNEKGPVVHQPSYSRQAERVRVR